MASGERDPLDKPMSPFAPAPSARPPSAEELRVQVRVPAPAYAVEEALRPAPAAPESASAREIERDPARYDTVPAPEAAAAAHWS